MKTIRIKSRQNEEKHYGEFSNILIIKQIPEMYTKATVLAGALEADPDAIGDTSPLWILRSAFETELKIELDISACLKHLLAHIR